MTSFSVAIDNLAMQDIPSQCGKDPDAFDNPGWDTGKTARVHLPQACRTAFKLLLCLCIHRTSPRLKKQACKMASRNVLCPVSLRNIDNLSTPSMQACELQAMLSLSHARSCHVLEHAALSHASLQTVFISDLSCSSLIQTLLLCTGSPPNIGCWRDDRTISPQDAAQFDTEMKEVIQQHVAFPSVVQFSVSPLLSWLHEPDKTTFLC